MKKDATLAGHLVITAAFVVMFHDCCALRTLVKNPGCNYGLFTFLAAGSSPARCCYSRVHLKYL